MDLGLRDKVAIVTGSSRGLGKASAAALAAEGARVVLNASDADWSNAIEWMFWPSLRLSRLVAPGMRDAAGE
jgi:NADP-dependent 3-hydroxy acid dehydrogenase YdfG